MHPPCFPCWRVLFFLLFLTLIHRFCHLSGVRVYALSRIFLSSGLFVWGFRPSILIMVLSISQGQLSRCLSLWWDFCCRASFYRLRLWYSFSYFVFHLMFDGVRFQYFQILVVFFSLLRFWFDGSLSYVICLFPLFLMSKAQMPNSIPISWLYILIVFIKVSNCFSLSANSLLSSTYTRWKLISCDSVDLLSALRLFIFGLVLWHINHCRLFNAKPFIYIYTKYKYIYIYYL